MPFVGLRISSSLRKPFVPLSQSGECSVICPNALGPFRAVAPFIPDRSCAPRKISAPLLKYDSNGDLRSMQCQLIKEVVGAFIAEILIQISITSLGINDPGNLAP
jgi:hypothetical protein